MKLKYAFMSFSTPALTLDEMLNLARRLGYDGIEPRIVSRHKHGIEWDADAAARKLIRRKAGDAGVALCCIATSCRYADPATHRQNVEETRRALDLAAEVGAPRLRVFGGAFPDDISRQQAIQTVADGLREVADHARERGVTICMETHDAWTAPDHVAAVMRQVNHPAIAVNWDYWHPVRQSGCPIEKAFATLNPWIRHVHFHDGSARADELGQRAIGAGDLDCKLVLKLLKGISYDGYLSGEWINWEPGEVHLPRELAAIQRLEAELG
ncbi:MAG: sugar phosphate isomerase/epimerase [Verrucomicrobia bacterium]|nr:sugar phosphate isomerase/epimerase [Verrucomicrobiota bacterium]